MSALTLLWGKSDRGEPSVYHPLLFHLIDSAMVADEIWTHVLGQCVKKRIAQQIGTDGVHLSRWIPYLVALHDIGKASPSFQTKNPILRDAIRAKGFRFPLGNKPHGILTTYIVKDWAKGRDTVLSGLDPSVRRSIAYALGGHHGIFPTPTDVTRIRPKDIGTGPWDKERLDMLHTLESELKVQEPLISMEADDTSSAFIFLSGLISIADWISSSEEFFPFETSVVEVPTYINLARNRAAAAMDNLHWAMPPAHHEPRPIKTLFPFIERTRPLQDVAVELAPSLNGHGIIIIEAPMGEGKTEAAVYLLDAWTGITGYGGFYIALPTQATANQMYGRIMQYLETPNLLDVPRDQRLRLLHGNAIIGERMRQVSDPPDTEYRDGPAPGADDWFSYRKRGLIAPLGIGTIDQMLLSVLRTKHFFVRLFGLSGKTVVIDEVHAYDVYMSTIIDRLLRHLAELGVNVILLSATLPERRRRELLNAYAGSVTKYARTNYPRISYFLNGNAMVRSFAPSRPSITVSIERMAPSLVDLPTRLDSATAVGGHVAVICNTVKSAQDVFRALSDHFGSRPDVEVRLFHARHMFKHRDAIERECLATFGKNERAPSARRIVVATQVIEQSLDLDFDLMVSEFAPVDLLLQRMGRLHRHKRTRPATLDAPKLWLLWPEADVDGIPQFGTTAYVYSKYVLLKSYMVLSGKDSIVLPNSIEPLVEAVYGDVEHGDLPEPIRNAMDEARCQYEKIIDQKKLIADSSMIPPPDDIEFWNYTERSREEDTPDIHPTLQAFTRLAKPSVRLVCLFKQGSILSLDHERELPINLDRIPDDDTILQLLGNVVTISDHRVFEHFINIKKPPNWERTGLLRDTFPAIFSKDPDGNQYSDGNGWRLGWNKRLGFWVI